jgi:hypothetical protein
MLSDEFLTELCDSFTNSTRRSSRDPAPSGQALDLQVRRRGCTRARRRSLPVRAFPQGGDRAYTITADQDCVVGEREQLARGLGRQPTCERLPIHLRCRTIRD